MHLFVDCGVQSCYIVFISFHALTLQDGRSKMETETNDKAWFAAIDVLSCGLCHLYLTGWDCLSTFNTPLPSKDGTSSFAPEMKEKALFLPTCPLILWIA